VFVWETETARELSRFQTAPVLEGLVLHSEDKRCIVAAEKVQEWDLETAELVREFEGIEGGQLDIALSADASRVATGGRDKTIYVWEVESGERIAKIGVPKMVESVSLNQDGSRVFAGLNGSSNDPVLLSISVDKPRDRRRLRGHRSTVNWVRHSADGRFVVSASRDRTIRIWDAKTRAELERFRGHQDWVWSAVFTPDGQQILSGGGGGPSETKGTDWSLRLWQVEPNEPAH
jgi:WD40 repeat protein